MARNKAEQRMLAAARSWPRKLTVTPLQLEVIKENALKDGVSPKFLDQWVEDYICVLNVL